MGCYGIGVSRIMSAIIEQHHDERGIAWPASIAPYQVHIVPISVKDETQTAVAEQLYNTLRKQGVDVLLDDRDERAGVKFNDSDLMGIPLRIIVGKDAVNGHVECVERTINEKQLMSIDEALQWIYIYDLFRDRNVCKEISKGAYDQYAPFVLHTSLE